MVKLYFIAFSLIFCLSCRKFEAADFTLEYFMDFQIEPDGNTLSTKVFSQILDSEWVKFLNQNNLNDSLIESVRPSAMLVEPIFGGPGNYDFISRAQVNIFTPHQPNTQLPIGDILLEPGDARGGRMTIFPGLTDVHDILRKGEFVLELALNYRFVVTSFSDHRLIVRFDVFLK